MKKLSYGENFSGQSPPRPYDLADHFLACAKLGRYLTVATGSRFLITDDLRGGNILHEAAAVAAGSSATKKARVQLARDAVDAVGNRLNDIGMELRKLAGLSQSGTYWDRPLLCKAVEDRRANRLIATTESTGGGGTARLLAQIKAYEEILEQARASGAERCAPKSLAEAEALAEFARVEIKLGHWFKAKDAAQRAGTLAVRTREEARPCAPKPKRPKKVVVPQKDSDNDGILDVDDACPEIPGLRKHKGCPPPDKDGDGFLDNEDKCPDKPEDFDGYQDNDGCPEEEDEWNSGCALTAAAALWARIDK